MAAISKTPSGSYRGVATSQPIDSVVDAVNNLQGNGTAGPVTASSLTATGPVSLAGLLTIVPLLLASAGATQGDATAITSQKALITVAATASTKGVRLPVATTGLEVEIGNAGAFGVKVYPATNGKIGAAATNAADSTVVAVNRANRYLAINTTLWVAQYGGNLSSSIPNTLTNTTLSGTLKLTPQNIVSAGATQAGATAITSLKAVVTTATASSKGVRLPTASTGLEVEIGNAGPTFGTKVYPATNGKIGAAATNVADTTVLAANKVNRYVAVNTTFWVVQRGA